VCVCVCVWIGGAPHVYSTVQSMVASVGNCLCPFSAACEVISSVTELLLSNTCYPVCCRQCLFSTLQQQ